MSVAKGIKQNILIFSNKIVALSVSSHFRKFKNNNNESSKSFILSLTSELFNNVDSTLKTTLKRLYHLKSSSSKFDKQTRSSKKSRNRSNCKDLNRCYLIRFKREAHRYRVFKILFLNNYINFIYIKALNLPSSTKFQIYCGTRHSIAWSHWKKIIKYEIISHIKNDIWILTRFLNERKVITDRWIFKIKDKLNKSIFKYKVCLEVYDYKQQFDIDSISIWVEIIKSVLLQFFFVLTEAYDLYIYQKKVLIAFLDKVLNETIYVSQ